MTVKLRPLEITDYEKGFFNVLSQLTSVAGTTKEKFIQRFNKVKSNENVKILVGEKDGKIICTGTLLIEEKFIHGCSNYGHIEDIAVDKSMRRTGIGKQVIHTLLDEAKKAGCFRVVLDCRDHNVPFYESCGLERVGNEMSIYFE